MIKRVFLGLLGLILLLALVLVANTLRQGSRQMVVAALPAITVDKVKATESLAAALRTKTVTGLLDPAGTAAEFEKLRGHLQQRYPLIHSRLQRESVGDSLLYTWPGRDASAQPMVLMAHQDVVPIAPGTESAWKQPPFEGRVIDGVIWGRGAMDNKGNLIAQFEAVEMLLAASFQPRQTVYLILGADEEVGGRMGALKIAAAFKQRGIKPAFVLDEGLVVTEGILPGVAKPIALIGIAEKGAISLRLSASIAPGHSSMPPGPGQSAIGMLAQALARLDARPMPGGINGVAAQMFEALAPELGAGQRLAMSNLWLLKPVVERMLSQGAATNALMRSTTAITIVNAGNKENVLPGRAEAVVNFRILPGDTAEQIEAHVQQAVADERIKIERLAEPHAASPISSATSAGYKHIERSVREVFADAIVVPGLYLAGADGRHFDGVADAVYRFTPIRANNEALKLFHGTDERISVDHLADMIRFYHRLLTLSAG